ncbi:hypothetical protein PHBOTO_004349 [Pseudozyma hubeiensis]|nr:hypothetical protein PHBOTO_004349 [Pseudozyma hubeiensis]
MKGFATLLWACTAAVSSGVALVRAQTSYGKSDCLTENCLTTRSGYLDGYNFDPAIVGGASWGTLWSVYPGGGANDQMLAQPLTYTPPGGSQSVIAMTEKNNVYVLDSATGATRSKLTLGFPFNAADAQCYDISPSIGITGTPVLDPATNTLYFWSKSYADMSGATTGLNNGRYRFYGVDAVTLQQKFAPVDIQGIHPANRPTISFEGGKQLQRTGLLLANGVVYAGFGGHCDNFNYTGWIVGMDASTGSYVTSWTSEAGAFGQNGAGIWQAGAGISWDGTNMWISTGNGYAGGEELGAQPRLGRFPPSALPMAVVKLAVDPSSRQLNPVDFFMPYDYRAIDASDQDFGSTGVAILPTGFSAGSVSRLAIALGKNAKAYVMNADSLGGYKTGSGGGDGVLQTIPLGGQSFSTAGAYPLDGGYVYISATGYPTIALKFGVNANGNPSFTQVGQTIPSASSTWTRGVGHSTTTSNNGQAGSGLLWVTDASNGNLRAFPAIPPANGQMAPIFVGNNPDSTKFSRPVPGNGRMFIVGQGGSVTAFGSPVNLPLNCTASLPFGDVVVGQSVTLAATCQPLIPFTLQARTLSDATFSISGFPATGTKYTTQSAPFSFNVTWTPKGVGSVSRTLNVNTANAQAGFVTSVPIVLRGNGVSSSATFGLAPNNVAFGGVVPGAADSVGGLNKSLSLSNLGLATLNILSWDFDETYVVGGVGDDDDDDDDDDAPTGDVDGTFDKKTTTGNFTLYGMPSTISGQGSLALTLNFNPSINGDYKANLTIYTNGGNASVLLTGSADGPARMHINLDQYDGRIANDSTYMDFGTVLTNTIHTQLLRVQNTGESALTITKSKPPAGPLIYAVNPASELTEGYTIAANTEATAKLQLALGVSQVNQDTYNTTSQWILNGNDPDFGVHFVEMSAQIVTRQVGPLQAATQPGNVNGTGRYRYLGCYVDLVNARTYPTQLNVNPATLDNGACMSAGLNTKDINGVGNFVGSEYAKECYASNMPPPASKKAPEASCDMACNGDPTQICGSGGFLSVFYDSYAYNATSGTFAPGADPTPHAVPNVTTSGGTVYTSSGCVADNVNNRALKAATYVDANLMTVESCAAFCAQGSYKYFGVEYAKECYCDNVLAPYAAANYALDGCNYICTGKQNEYCGGSSKMNLYTLSGAVSTTTTTTSSTSSSASTTSSTASASTTSTSSTSSASSTTSTTSSSSTSSTSSASTDSATTTSSSSSSTSTTTTSSSASATASVTSPSSPSTLAYRGCFNDVTWARVLPVQISSLPDQTVEKCTAQCLAAGYSIAGVEYGQECWCGNAMALSTTKQATDAPCNMPCTGNATEMCGAGNLINVYSNQVNLLPVQPATAGAFTSLGCYSDSINARTLQGAQPALGQGNSVESCAQQCANFNYFGVEYADECYCGNTLLNGASQQPSGDCNMVCSGNATELCGGSNRIGLYQNTAALGASSSASSSASSTTSSSASSSTTSSSATSSSTSSSTTTTTTSASSSSSSSSSSSTTTSSSSTSSSSASTTSSTTTTSSVPTPAPTTTTTTTTSSSSTTTSSTSSAAPSPSGFKALGCYLDSVNARSLAYIAWQNNNKNTASACYSTCKAKGYRFSGTEYGGECYCDNFLLNQAYSAGPGAMGCNYLCPGDSSQVCGGSNRINIVQDTTWKQSMFTVNRSGKWTFNNCYADSVNARILNVTLYQNNGQSTVEKCLAACSASNLSVCGVQYAGECFGAMALPSSSKIAPNQGANDPLELGCNYGCTGNTTQACGGNARMNVYTFDQNAVSVSPSTVLAATNS